MNGRIFWVMGLFLVGLVTLACGAGASPVTSAIDGHQDAPVVAQEHAHEVIPDTTIHEHSAQIPTVEGLNPGPAQVTLGVGPAGDSRQPVHRSRRRD